MSFVLEIWTQIRSWLCKIKKKKNELYNHIDTNRMRQCIRMKKKLDKYDRCLFFHVYRISHLKRNVNKWMFIGSNMCCNQKKSMKYSNNPFLKQKKWQREKNVHLHTQHFQCVYRWHEDLFAWKISNVMLMELTSKFHLKWTAQTITNIGIIKCVYKASADSTLSWKVKQNILIRTNNQKKSAQCYKYEYLIFCDEPKKGKKKIYGTIDIYGMHELNVWIQYLNIIYTFFCSLLFDRIKQMVDSARSFIRRMNMNWLREIANSINFNIKWDEQCSKIKLIDGCGFGWS